MVKSDIWELTDFLQYYEKKKNTVFIDSVLDPRYF